MKTHRREMQKHALGYKMVLPATMIIILVTIIPMIRGIYLGFTNSNIFLKREEFIGLGNYAAIFQNAEFKSALLFTFIYSVGVVILSYFFGLLLAFLLNRDIRFRGFFRAVALMPWIIPPIVASTNWAWILNDRLGIVNNTLIHFGLITEPILFLADPLLAKFTVIGIGAWKSYPFMMIVLLAGLQSIPKELYEAARIDGAGYWKSLRYITMPMLKTVSFICTTLMFIWTFNNFENIYLQTRGGPVRSTFVLSILTYFMAFLRGTLGYAGAITSLMLIVLLAISLVYLRILKVNSSGQRDERTKT